jgi:hypothetical protein
MAGGNAHDARLPPPLHGRQCLTLGNDRDTLPVGKVWQEVDARQFLVEFTPLKLIARKLPALPEHASVTPPRRGCA